MRPTKRWLLRALGLVAIAAAAVGIWRHASYWLWRSGHQNVAVAATAEGPSEDPRVFLLDPELLQLSRERVQAGDAELQPAMDRLRAQADAAVTAGPFSVVDKPFTPPSGDKHDYMSLSIYWWPNPITKDGKPYVHRDGERNPEANEYDGARIAPMAGAVETLALAYHFTDHAPYAEHAAHLLRVWFLEEATRMNPNLNYGQGIPGLCAGARQGIIETVVLARQVVDAVGLVAASEYWTSEDQRGLQAWFAEYLNWLRTSGLGWSESLRGNNHGTYYDLQVTTFALFVGDQALARQTLESSKARIAKQFQPDGSQPHELHRTKSWDYSLYNLRAWFALAWVGEKLDIDLWNHTSDDGRGLRAGLDFLTPYANGSKEWPHKQIKKFSTASLFPFLRQAAIVYDEPAYEEVIDSLPGSPEGRAADRANLIWPRSDPPREPSRRRH